MLLRRSLGTLGAGGSSCSTCERTPLAGERLHELDSGTLLCDLCFGALPEEQRLAVRSQRSGRASGGSPSSPRPPEPARRGIESRRYAPGDRGRAHLRAARGRVRLRRGPGRPPGLDRSTTSRTTASPARTRTGWAPPRFVLRRRSPRSTWSSRSPSATGRGGSSRRRVGRRGRNRSVAVYEFAVGAGGPTRRADDLQRAGYVIDRIKQTGAAGWIKAQHEDGAGAPRLVFEDPPARPLARSALPATSRSRRPATAPEPAWTRRGRGGPGTKGAPSRGAQPDR